MQTGKNFINHLFLMIFLLSVSFDVNAGLFKKRVKMNSESVGSYWNGSLKNGVALKEEGRGYQVVRTSRKRYYGHDNLVKFIETLGDASAKKKLGIILIGDMGKEKGGRIPGLHHSHQIGLDADIFYSLIKNPLANSQREKRGPQTVLSARGSVDPNKWTPAHSQLLKLTSEDDRVERIFVNHAIKKHLCKLHPKAEWLTKIRPMGGHTGHFHVRLACPDNSPLCQPQPKPVNTECG